MRGQCLLQGAIEYARLHHRAAIAGADLDDAVHAGERQHDAAGQRHGRAGGASAGATCDQRYVMGPACAHQCLHLFDAGRLRDGGGALMTPRVVLRVGLQRAVIHAPALRAQQGGQFGNQGSRQGRTHDGSRGAAGAGWISFQATTAPASGSHTQRSSDSRVARPRALKNCGANGETRIGRHGAKKRCSLQGQARATPRPPEVIASSSGWLAAQTKTNTAACTVDATVGPALVGANLGWHEAADQGWRLPELCGADQDRRLPKNASTAANAASTPANSSEWLAPRWPNASA